MKKLRLILSVLTFAFIAYSNFVIPIGTGTKSFWKNCGLFNYSKDIQQDNKRISIHEAGHALVADLLGFKVSKATRKGKNDYAGYVEYSYSKSKQKENVMVNLAGYVAEELIFGTSCYGVSDDLNKATKASFKLAGSAGHEFMQQNLDKTRNLIYNNIDKLQALAETIDKRVTISGKQIHSVIKATGAAVAA